jgi:Immunity protein 8
VIKLELRGISSPDVSPDEWVPIGNRAYVLLQLEIGVVGESGGDTFDVIVATPDGLSGARDDAIGALAQRATIVVRRFSWETVYVILNDIIRRCESDAWDDSVLRLQRYFKWEYEDYVMEQAPERRRGRN